jgi:hypothetical protein
MTTARAEKEALAASPTVLGHGRAFLLVSAATMILALLGELPSGSVIRRLLDVAAAAALAENYFALCVGLTAELMRQRSETIDVWWLAGFVRNLRRERPLTARIAGTVRLFRRQAVSNAMQTLLVFIIAKDEAQHWGWSL